MTLFSSIHPASFDAVDLPEYIQFQESQLLEAEASEGKSSAASHHLAAANVVADSRKGVNR
jgi:hypothetical protein